MKKQYIKSNRYESINGLRTLACIGIALMHILKNISYNLNGDLLNLIIGQFGNFVIMFMVISSFGMCSGYYNKIKDNQISPNKFYSKRIIKLLPFFIFLIFLDLVIEHNVPSLIEGFANSTLLFNLLQKDITVIGVSWFLGLVFLFYIMFPYFTFLFENKKRAWLTTIISILMNLSCIYYFNVGRTNMFYSFMFFCIGGLVYLYKENIIKYFSKSKIIGLMAIIASIIIYFTLPIKNEYLVPLRTSIISISLLVYAISYDSLFLNNKITAFVGNISFEVYLCHMVIFRIIEKINVSRYFGCNWISYIITSLLVICGSIVLSFSFKKIYSKLEKRVIKNENIIS